MKKIGIITFHNSYNCGSMLQTYAIHKVTQKMNFDSIIINFSSEGQQILYSVFQKKINIKNIIKNILIFPVRKKIRFNFDMYEKFKNDNFKLTNFMTNGSELKDDDFDIVIAGSDQIWNITILDYDDAYFLPWVKKAKKIAYAPSFGAKKISKNTTDEEKYKSYLNSFDFLSIREKNGQKWLKEMIGKDVPVVLDPTLLLEREDYETIIDSNCTPKEKYIFFYSPSFNREICEYVRKISKKYNLKVITWSTKSYYIKMIKSFGFELPEYESPSVYLDLIKNAELILTTSYHGTIFSTIFRKKFITIKNGQMYGDDDRVITLLEQLSMMERLIPHEFDENFDYLQDVDYSNYEKKVAQLREKSMNYIKQNIEEYYNE